MFTKNLIITFLSLVVGILSYFKFNSDNDIQENYINYNLAAVPETINLNTAVKFIKCVNVETTNDKNLIGEFPKRV